MEIKYTARSHIGKIRKNNEDNLYAAGVTLPPGTHSRPFSIDGSAVSPAVFAVCDGMGGESDGELASELAVKNLSTAHEKINATAKRNLNDAIQTYIDDTNTEINLEANGKRVGTTLALVAITKKGTCCFNVGDSAIFCLRRGVFSKISNDHIAPGSHKLTRCIGIGNARQAESYPVIKGKCRILICSDGLTDMVSASDIQNAMCTYNNASDAANSLLEAALANGGRDNVTIIILDISKIPMLRFLRHR